MNDLGKFQVASISVLPVEIKGDIVQPHSTSLICKAASLCAIVAQGLLLVLHWRCGAGDFETNSHGGTKHAAKLKVGEAAQNLSHAHANHG